MSDPIIDPERIVLGTLMQATPAEARPFFSRLDLHDFTDPPGVYVFDLMVAIVADDVPSLDPATLLGFADRRGALTDTNRAHLLTRWIFDAFGTNVPLVALDFHIDRLIEHSYRRRVTASAARLAQAAEMCSVRDIDGHVLHVTTQLALHRARITAATPVRVADARSAA